MDWRWKRDGEYTADQEGPKRSEEGSVIITQSGESLGKPRIWRAISVGVPSSYVHALAFGGEELGDGLPSVGIAGTNWDERR